MARILFVDDDEPIRLIGSSALQSEGHEVELAENGKKALDKISTGAFDLVITDIVMPDVEGIELIVELKRRDPNLPIIAISGGGRKGNTDFLEIAGKLGASMVLRKPFHPQHLFEAVNRCLKP